jgi:hypothetical protein
MKKATRRPWATLEESDVFSFSVPSLIRLLFWSAQLGCCCAWVEQFTSEDDQSPPNPLPFGGERGTKEMAKIFSKELSKIKMTKKLKNGTYKY